MPSAPTDQGDPSAVWRQRMTAARAELEELRAKRQKAEEEHIALRRQLWYRWGFIDADVDAKMLAKINELDQRIRDKEYEINTAIPDEARRAGVPPGALSQ